MKDLTLELSKIPALTAHPELTKELIWKLVRFLPSLLIQRS
jgi:hypothetical protein